MTNYFWSNNYEIIHGSIKVSSLLYYNPITPINGYEPTIWEDACKKFLLQVQALIPFFVFLKATHTPWGLKKNRENGLKELFKIFTVNIQIFRAKMGWALHVQSLYKWVGSRCVVWIKYTIFKTNKSKMNTYWSML